MERIYLDGSSDVRSAGNTIYSASENIKQASNNISNALYEHQRFLDEWLVRLENILKENKNDSINI